MKPIRSLMFAVLIGSVALSAHARPLQDIYLRLVTGDVQVKTGDTEGFVPAAINTPLSEGDRIWVPQGGRTELKLSDGSVVRLDGNTALDVLSSDRGIFQFYLRVGHAYCNVRDPKDSIVALDTPSAALRSYTESIFRVDVAGDGSTETEALAGDILGETEKGQIRISAGDRVVFPVDAAGPVTGTLDLPGEWERWNQAADEGPGGSDYAENAGYLPDDLAAYSSDLDQNGQWAYENDYGYVWTPVVAATGVWSPYRLGRWVWMRGKYVWISHEPWGWAPYHFGRWTYLKNRGWCWVPPKKGSASWGPGYVAWNYNQKHVSWVPLAPGERHSGRSGYGVSSVSTPSGAVKAAPASKFKNSYVKGGVVTQTRNAFVQGGPERVAFLGNPFAKGGNPMTAPHIKPDKGALMPAAREIPQIKAPPMAIREARASEQVQSARITEPVKTYSISGTHRTVSASGPVSIRGLPERPAVSRGPIVIELRGNPTPAIRDLRERPSEVRAVPPIAALAGGPRVEAAHLAPAQARVGYFAPVQTPHVMPMTSAGINPVRSFASHASGGGRGRGR